MSDCLSDEMVLGFVQAELSPEAARRADEHIATCARCRGVVAETARQLASSDAGAVTREGDVLEQMPTMAAAAAGRARQAALEPGAKVSRYEVQELIGAGGGGAVYAAYDPQLKRRVALKILRTAGGVRASAGTRARLVREAEAMARLGHPNVVQVHDAGEVEGDLFLVMELVEGETLTRWLAREKRSWREIVSIFVEAGRGVAAAHGVGLVHGDFKPDNVLVGADGRVRVSDFGLARPVRARLETAGIASTTGEAAASDERTAVAGTPAYMAPEQFEGRGSDERTDQFSFCVALAWALYGRHPFATSSSPVRVARPGAGATLAPPPPDTNVPPRLYAILARGLSTDREARWPSIAGLIAALGDIVGPTPRRRLVRVALSVGPIVIAAAVAAAVVGMRAGRPPETAARHPSPAFRADKLAEMDAAVERAVAAGQLPGGVLWLERGGERYEHAYGRRALDPASEPISEDTIFDAAGLTKILATTPVIVRLIERGVVALDAPVVRYIPEFGANGKETVTVRHLLTHTSGLRPGLNVYRRWEGYDTALRLICDDKPRAPPGQMFTEGDINFILLGEIVARVTGHRLDEVAAREIFEPLGMKDTGFRPSAARRGQIAPTERTDGGVLRGVVHDPAARRMGGVTGHAGVFTTAADLARFARMVLAGGELDGARVLSPESVALMTSVQSPPDIPGRRGLGWDIDSTHPSPGGRHFPLGSFGAAGWTGTSLWIDPFSRTFVMFLSNRNHPTEAGDVRELRGELATLAAESIVGFDFASVPSALARLVWTGIDVLARQEFAPLRGLRVGLVTNHTGHDRRRLSTIERLLAAPEVELKALFSPEHGLHGDEDSPAPRGRGGGAPGRSVDAATGLPVYDLGGPGGAPAPEQLEGLDALVFDVQDVGARFYTYVSTMSLALEAAGRHKKKFFVLDRPNPINGVTWEGPVMVGPARFVGFHAVPVRHGMTAGELARMLNDERDFRAELTVVGIDGWRRDHWFDETGLPWTAPSPNLRTLAAAALYPGIALLERAAVSVGRGTDTPFELVGAPYIDDVRLAAELARAGLPGVRFTPVRFTPKAQPFASQACAGVAIHVTDRGRLRAVDVGLAIAAALNRLYPQKFDVADVDRLLFHPPTITALREGRSIDEIHKLWAPDLAAFAARRAKYLLYR